ncbi:MAG TPA: hypothetical protein PKV82_12610 [Anaerolineae bacterium]|nr:hypothetical protein [Anaerolineae bacterium]
MSFRQLYTTSEWQTLQFAPLWVLSAMGGAISTGGAGQSALENQIKALAKEIGEASLFKDPLAREVLMSLGTQFGSLWEQYGRDSRNVEQGLQDVAQILSRKASSEQSQGFKAAMLLIGNNIAKAAGNAHANITNAALVLIAVLLDVNLSSVANQSSMSGQSTTPSIAASASKPAMSVPTKPASPPLVRQAAQDRVAPTPMPRAQLFAIWGGLTGFAASFFLAKRFEYTLLQMAIAFGASQDLPEFSWSAAILGALLGAGIGALVPKFRAWLFLLLFPVAAILLIRMDLHLLAVAMGGIAATIVVLIVRGWAHHKQRNPQSSSQRKTQTVMEGSNSAASKVIETKPTDAVIEKQPISPSLPVLRTDTQSITVDDPMGAYVVERTYKIHSAPDAKTAIAFLAHNPVIRMHEYLVVETPQENYGRDISGIFHESSGVPVGAAQLQEFDHGMLVIYAPEGTIRGLWLDQKAYAIAEHTGLTHIAQFSSIAPQGKMIAAIFPKLPVGKYQVELDIRGTPYKHNIEVLPAQVTELKPAG